MPMDDREALETFNGDVLALVIVGRDGKIRLWTSDEIETLAQHEWLRQQIQFAAQTAVNVGGAGNA